MLIDKNLHKIALYNILYSCKIHELGLFNGKMGLILFFFHYARYTQDYLYESFAAELMEDIYSDIDPKMNLHMADGLCGIGWGILYLIKNNFVIGNLDEVLHDIDVKVMELAPLRMKDLSFDTGLIGIACYVYFRLNNNQSLPLLFNEDYLNELNIVCSNIKSLQKFDFFNEPLRKITNCNYSKDDNSWKKGLKLMTI